MEWLVGLYTTGGCPSSFELIAHCWSEDLKVGKAAAYLFTFQRIWEVTVEATTVRHQGSALLLKTEEKTQNNHNIHSKTLFREMLSVHMLFVMLSERRALLFSPLGKPWWICGFPISAASSVCGSLSKAQDTLRLPTAQYFCSTNSILWHSEIWLPWQDTGLTAGTRI